MQRYFRKFVILLLLVASVSISSSALASTSRDEPTDPIARIVSVIKHVVRGLFPIHTNDDTNVIPPTPH
jgi:hypothetical protein